MPKTLDIPEYLMDAYLNSHYLRFQARPDTPTDQMTSYVGDDFCGGKIALGGTGSAKSVTSCFILAREIYRNPPPQPNTPIWVGSQTYDLVGSIWSQALSRYITPDQIANIRWRKAGLFPEIVQLKPDEFGNNYNIHFFSYEQGRMALQSANVWAALLDEQAPPEVIEEIWGRLRTWRHPNMFLYALTPLEVDPWLEDLHERKDSPEVQGLWRFYHLDTMANTHISTEWKKAYLDSLPPDVRLTRQYGHFSCYRGAVFPEFTNDLIIDIPDLGEHKKYIGCDWGFHHPAAVWLSEKDGTYYVTHELQLQDTMPDDFAKKVKEIGYDYRHKVIVDSEDIISARYFNQAGIITTITRKAKTDSINNLKSLMFSKKFFVSKTCKETIKQLHQYRWREYPEGKENKDEVIKDRDHIVDGCLYVTYTNLKSIVKPWSQPNIPHSPKLVNPKANPAARIINPMRR